MPAEWTQAPRDNEWYWRDRGHPYGVDFVRVMWGLSDLRGDGTLRRYSLGTWWYGPVSEPSSRAEPGKKEEKP